jgi:gliding motility-associated-like protein
LVTIYEPLNQLGFEIVQDEVSLSDSPTGYAIGEVLTSGGDPYEALIQLVEPAFEMNINDIIEFNEGRRWVKAVSTGDNLNKFLIRFDSLWAGLYEIVVVDDYGCEFVIDHSIGFDQAIFIPNVFTPNDDGYNDAFYIRNLPENGTKVVVTSRSGAVVFESDNYTYENLWDGGDVADGIYFYNISLPNGEFFKGWVEKWRGSRP